MLEAFYLAGSQEIILKCGCCLEIEVEVRRRDEFFTLTPPVSLVDGEITTEWVYACCDEHMKILDSLEKLGGLGEEILEAAKAEYGVDSTDCALLKLLSSTDSVRLDKSLEDLISLSSETTASVTVEEDDGYPD